MVKRSNMLLLRIWMLLFLCGPGLFAPGAAAAVKKTKPEQSGLSPVHVPHKDPERVQTSYYSLLQGFVTKKLPVQEFPFTACGYLLAGNFTLPDICEQSLYCKGYLAHIYPSHNFW